MASARKLAQIARWSPTRFGIRHRTTSPMANVMPRTRHGAYQGFWTGSVVTTRRSASFALGVTHSARKRTMKGIAGGRPLSHVVDPEYLVDRDPAMPTSNPPRNVSGRLEKPPIAAAPNA